MKLLNSVEKQLKNLMGKNALMFIAGAVVVYMIYQYSSNKGLSLDGMQNESETQQKGGEPAMQESAGQPAPSAGSVATNVAFASADGMSTSQPNMASGCGQKPTLSPDQLLPVQNGGGEFDKLNPSSGQGELQGVNLLQAGHHIGTVGQSLRNANLQVRSEPANPQTNVGPWMNTTMEPDNFRRPLEIGAGAQ